MACSLKINLALIRKTLYLQLTDQMKKQATAWLSFMFLLFATTLSAADAVGDYRSAATGNWNAIATWERCTVAGSPGTWVAAAAAPASLDGVITIRSPNVVTISANGLSYDQVVV